MRWAIACMVALGGVASARVIRIPPVAAACSEEQTWDDVATCAAKLGTMKIERTLPHARLVRITNDRSGIHGIYLFVERNKTWRLGGMYEDEVAVLGLDALTFGGHSVYRVSFGVSEHSDVSLDDSTMTPVVFVQRDEMYCTGAGYRCTTVRTSCDALVAGKTQLTFRGTVSWKDGALHVAGDRSHAGTFCDEREVAPLSFLDDSE
jgi:hypothetical protein